MITTRPTDEIVGTGYRAMALVNSLKARLVEKGFDPTKLVAEESLLLDALPKVEREQSAQEEAWHASVQKTGDTKNQVATKAACLCDMVISAFTRNSPEGEAAMAVRAGLYSGPERRDPTTSTPAAQQPVAAADSSTSAPRSTAPDASSTIAA